MVDIGVEAASISRVSSYNRTSALAAVLLFQRVNKRRDQQHVAMMAQLNDQDPRRVQRAAGEVSGVILCSSSRIRVPISRGSKTD